MGAQPRERFEDSARIFKTDPPGRADRTPAKESVTTAEGYTWDECRDVILGELRSGIAGTLACFGAVRASYRATRDLYDRSAHCVPQPDDREEERLQRAFLAMRRLDGLMSHAAALACVASDGSAEVPRFDAAPDGWPTVGVISGGLLYVGGKFVGDEDDEPSVDAMEVGKFVDLDAKGGGR